MMVQIQDLQVLVLVSQTQILKTYFQIGMLLRINLNFILVTSPVEFISNISLKRKMSKQDRNNLLMTLPVLKTELFLSYEDMTFGGAILQ